MTTISNVYTTNDQVGYVTDTQEIELKHESGGPTPGVQQPPSKVECVGRAKCAIIVGVVLVALIILIIVLAVTLTKTGESILTYLHLNLGQHAFKFVILNIQYQ